MYSTIDMPRQAEPAGRLPSAADCADRSPMVRLFEVEVYFTLSTSIDGDTA